MPQLLMELNHLQKVPVIKENFFRNMNIIKKLINQKIYVFIPLWIFGFFVLLSFDFFVEGFVFEWLDWNGTRKNDWFFALWWGFNFLWFSFGIVNIYFKLKNK